MPSDIVEEARQMISPDDLRTEDMLEDIHRLRIQTAQARDEANAAQSEVNRLMRQLRERLGAIETERQEVLAQAREEAAEELETLQTEVRALRRRLQAAAAPLEVVTAVEEAIEELEPVAPTSQSLDSLTIAPPPRRPIRVGDTVWVDPLNAVGQVLVVSDQEAEVQVGPARTRVSLAVLELRAPPPVPEEPTVHVSTAPSPGVQIDLRGCTVDDALEQLDQHLDAAMRAELPWIHIIHGKGTGALRRAVRLFLGDHPFISSYESGGAKEGGAGVTVAKLV
jgi:DNA mismatch repair protein MutS2